MGNSLGWLYCFRGLGIRRESIRYNVFGYGWGVVGDLLLLREANLLLFWCPNPSDDGSLS